MTPTGYLLSAGTLLALLLVVLAMVGLRSSNALPRRPLPLPPKAPEWAADVTGSGRVAMRREGKHHADDLDGHTVDISPRMGAIYRPDR